MKKIFLTLSVIALSCVAMAQTPDRSYLKTFDDTVSYYIGYDLFKGMGRQNPDVDMRIVARSIVDAADGFSEDITPEMMQDVFSRYQQVMEERMKARTQKNIEEGKAFLEANKKEPGVVALESGLQYKIVSSGNGKKPAAEDVVKVHYTGKLIEGKVFDSSVERGEPITFPLNQVIPGWSEGVQQMDEGSTYILYIPYNLGYGEMPAGEIPAGSTLIFEVQLLQINPPQE